jgi:hypothetical protein
VQYVANPCYTVRCGTHFLPYNRLEVLGPFRSFTCQNTRLGHLFTTADVFFCTRMCYLIAPSTTVLLAVQKTRGSLHTVNSPPVCIPQMHVTRIMTYIFHSKRNVIGSDDSYSKATTYHSCHAEMHSFDELYS